MYFYVGIPVGSVAGSLDWYERLLGKAPDMIDGNHAAIWDMAEGRSLYIVDAPDHIGHAIFSIYVDDLAAAVSEIEGRGITPDETQEENGVLNAVNYRDPDGNEIGYGLMPAQDDN
jgi:catechol 2,3-dioxygenase-like lactoylglutathione lyase family enzyme